MGDGRKILDDLRGALQEGVDEVERTGARQLDRLAKSGVERLEQLREEIGTASDDTGTFSRQRTSDSRRRGGRRASAPLVLNTRPRGQLGKRCGSRPNARSTGCEVADITGVVERPKIVI